MSGSKPRQTIRPQCSETRASIEEWLDDSLDGEARTRIDGHLSGCRECSELFSRHRALAADLLALGRAANALAGTVGPRAAWRLLRWRSISAVAASLLFMAAAGLYLVKVERHGAAPPSPPTVATEPSEDAGAAETVAGDAGDFGIASSQDQFVVRLKSNNPRIHIVWVYDQAVTSSADTSGAGSHEPESSG